MGRGAAGKRGGHRRRLQVGAWACGLVAAAAAQEAPSPQRVEVSTSAAAERRDEVAGRQVIGAAELARHGDTRLTEALRRVPGLQLRGSGADLSLLLDGMSAEQTLVLVNGEPVPRLLALEALAVAQVERVEIVRGANVQWSGRGLAGTINIVTTRDVQRPQRDLTLTAGSHFGRPVGQADLALAARDGATGWRLGLSLRGERERYPVEQSLRFSDADGRLRSAYRVHLLEASHDDGVSLSPQWQWTGAEGRRVQFDGLLSASRLAGAGDEWRSDLEGELPHQQRDRLSYRHDRQLLRLRAEVQWPLTAATRAQASASVTRGRRDQSSLLEGWGFDGARVRDSTVDSTRIDRLQSARASLEHRIGAVHVLAAGVQLEGNGRHEDRVQRERIPSWEPDLSDERYDAQARSVAVYAQHDWLPTRQLTLSWGARLERLRTRSEGNVFDGVSQHHQLGSPMLNLLWRPDTHSQWKLGLSRAYRLPEPRDIMPRRWTRAENSSLVPDFFGNPELRPESAWTLQLGWDRRLDGEGDPRLGLNAVLKRISDVVLQELVVLDGRYLLRPLNRGEASVASLQLRGQAEWPAPWGGPVAVSGSLTAQHSRLEGVPGPDNRLPDQAPWEAQLEATHRPTGSAWSLALGTRWRAAYAAQLPSGRRVQRGDTRGLDLSATWQADPGNRWRASVTALGAGDEFELLRRQGADGSDELVARTRREPRLSLQWLHRL